MPEMRKDPLTGTWVLIAPERKLRPQYQRWDTLIQTPLLPAHCPFCPGNESMTPPEIYALRHQFDKANQSDDSHNQPDSGPDQPGWRLRVVPNKFPALQREGELHKVSQGFYHQMQGIGAHEVIIESDSHEKNIEQLPLSQITDIFLTYKQRILELKQDKRLRYIQVFKNQGALAGATVSHTHSQIAALPVVPARVREKLAHAQQYYKNRKRCIYCDLIHQEKLSGKRILIENDYYLVASPYAPRIPFELIIFPKFHSPLFENTGDEKLPPLAALFGETLKRLNQALNHPSYNMVLQNAPVRLTSKQGEYYHWHLELLPITSGTGGFEIATHCYINAIPPEEAAETLRKVEV